MNDNTPSLKLSPSSRKSIKINNLKPVIKTQDGSINTSRKQSSTVSQNIRVAHLLVNVQEEKIQKQAEIIEKQKRVKEGYLTSLLFIYVNGERKLINIDKIINSYFELQNEIVHYTSLKYLYAIEYENGSVVKADKFQTTSLYHIREIIDKNLQKLKFYPQLPIKWEFTDYHACPKDWVDNYELKQQLLKKLKEDEERKKIDMTINSNSSYFNDLSVDNVIDNLEKAHLNN